MIAKLQLKAFIKAIAIVMLFITFFTNYLLFRLDLVESFIRGVITYIVATLILNVVFFIWRVSFRNEEWKLMIEGPKVEQEDEEEDFFDKPIEA